MRGRRPPLFDGSHRHRQPTEGRPHGAPFAILVVVRSCREESGAAAGRRSSTEPTATDVEGCCGIWEERSQWGRDGSHRHRQPTEGRLSCPSTAAD